MVETEQTQNPDVVDQAVENHEKSPQESFAELRKAKEDLQRQLWQAQKEKELFERQMQMQMQYQQQSKQPPPEEDFDYRQLEQEEYPDGKRLVKALNSFDKKLNSYERKLAEKDQKILILETAQEFSDFKQVVTPENIEKYIKSDEDNREAVEKAANPLRKVYNLIKKELRYQSGNAPQPEKVGAVTQEQKRIEDKETKPKTSAVGVRSEAVTFAAHVSNSRMTKQQKEALWRDTLSAARK
jgi:hypothetical protein